MWFCHVISLGHNSHVHKMVAWEVLVDYAGVLRKNPSLIIDEICVVVGSRFDHLSSEMIVKSFMADGPEGCFVIDGKNLRLKMSSVSDPPAADYIYGDCCRAVSRLIMAHMHRNNMNIDIVAI